MRMFMDEGNRTPASQGRGRPKTSQRLGQFARQPPLEIPAAVIALLLDGYQCAGQLGCGVWEFAIEISSLHAAGATNNHLRWLLHREYVNHGVEIARIDSRQRHFHKIGNLSLPDRTCFVLTRQGLVRFLAGNRAAKERHVAVERSDGPVWDRVRRELRVGQVVVKRFKQPAGSQELILNAFEEEEWSERIDDPLPPEKDQDAKKRLHTTIRNLNRSHGSRLIQFAGGGDGQSICWRRLSDAERLQSDSRPKVARLAGNEEDVPCN